MASSSAKPGLMPEPNIVEPPCWHASAIRSRPSPRLWPVMNDGGGHDVHARRQDAHQLVDVDPHRVVDDAVGLQREQRVDVVGGGRRRAVRCRTARRRRGRPCPATRRSSRRARGRVRRRSPRPSSFRRCPSSTGRPGKGWCLALAQHREGGAVPAMAFGHKIDGCGQEASVALPVRCWPLRSIQVRSTTSPG